MLTYHWHKYLVECLRPLHIRWAPRDLSITHHTHIYRIGHADTSPITQIPIHDPQHHEPQHGCLPRRLLIWCSVCLVFLLQDLNMRELTKKYGRNVGLSLDAVGMYSCQLLVALRHLKRNSILHADIKVRQHISATTAYPWTVSLHCTALNVRYCTCRSDIMLMAHGQTPCLY